jgi:hypothetical protein
MMRLSTVFIPERTHHCLLLYDQPYAKIIAAISILVPYKEGRSHLLHAACAALSQHGEAVGYVPLDKRTYFMPEVLDGIEQLALVCIDNIECIAGDKSWEMAIQPI